LGPRLLPWLALIDAGVMAGWVYRPGFHRPLDRDSLGASVRPARPMYVGSSRRDCVSRGGLEGKEEEKQ
jgi:hypothetical protein